MLICAPINRFPFITYDTENQELESMSRKSGFDSKYQKFARPNSGFLSKKYPALKQQNLLILSQSRHERKAIRQIQ